jgi:GMP synthase-like glutamine amidotransferase
VQLLASSLGARVYAGPAPEVGVLPVHLTAEAADDPVFAGLPETVPTLQWHGDTFELPDGAVLLATSPAYPNQAFRVGRAAYGVQFHIEVTTELSHEWSVVPAYVEYADRVLGPGGIEGLLADFAARTEEMQAHARGMFGRWLDLVGARVT